VIKLGRPQKKKKKKEKKKKKKKRKNHKRSIKGEKEVPGRGEGRLRLLGLKENGRRIRFALSRERKNLKEKSERKEERACR